MSLDELISEGKSIFANKTTDRFGFEYVNYGTFDQWKRKALMFLQETYPNHPQVLTFEEHLLRILK